MISLPSLYLCVITCVAKKFLLTFKWNFPCFNLCPLHLVLSLGTTERSLALLSLLLSQVFMCMDKPP